MANITKIFLPEDGRTWDIKDATIKKLPAENSVESTDKLLVVDDGDGHLITTKILKDYISDGIESDKHFTFIQSVPSDTWVIEHNLGKKPSVSVVDSAGTNVVGEYVYIDDNNIILRFTGVFSGKAYLN